MALTQEEIDGLSPGIRDAVLWFQQHGYETCDSGDGSNLAEGMECGWDHPMVVICNLPRAFTLAFADALAFNVKNERGAKGLHVELSYVPGEPALIVVSDPEKTGDFSKLSPAPTDDPGQTG